MNCQKIIKAIIIGLILDLYWTYISNKIFLIIINFLNINEARNYNFTMKVKN